MKINFKAAGKADAELIVEMMRTFYYHEQLEFNYENNLKIVHQLLLNHEIGNIFLIFYDEKLIGYVVFTYGFSIEYEGILTLIDEIYIQEEFRNKGIGTMTLNYVEEICKAKGIKTIHLQVKNFNPQAKKLYNSLGYKDIDRVFMKKIAL